MELCLGSGEKLIGGAYGTELKGGQGQVIFLPWSSLTGVPATLPELQMPKVVIGRIKNHLLLEMTNLRTSKEAAGAQVHGT